MIVTATEREQYKRCRRRWDYGSLSRQGLTKIVGPAAFSLGTLVHSSLEGWLQDPKASVLDFFLDASVRMIEDAKKKYSEKMGMPISDEELQPIYESIELGRHMVVNYQAYWKTPLKERFHLVSTEQKVTVPIVGEHQLECKFDGIIEDDKGRLYILEHKTYDKRPHESALRGNAQFLTYIWALKQMYGNSVAGLAYDGIWKRPAPPKGKTLDDMFMRHLLIRPPEELDEFTQMIVWEVEDMANNPQLYINRRWEGCYDCLFDALCTAQSRGEDYEYVKRTMYTLRDRDQYEAEL